MAEMNFPLLFDGAFGTYYYALTGDGELCERANLLRADVVRRIHRAYLSAGANVIRTNTFAVNVVNFPEEAQRFSVLKAGVELARECAQPFDATVFASVGSVADKTLAAASYLAVCKQLLSLDVRHVLFETLDSLEGVEEAVRFLREHAPDVQIAVSFGAGQDGVTARGLSAERLVHRAEEIADFVGFNCRMGPTHLAHLMRRLGRTRVPLFALPNAGYPALVGGRTVFENNPEYFAEKTAELLALGAAGVGGCCGTTPRHVECLAAQLHGRETVHVVHQGESHTPNKAEVPPLSGRGKKFVAVELDPPVDADLSFFLSAARSVIRAGADALTISDSPFSKTRADSLLCALRLFQEGAPTVIPHITCRDKNRVALKGGLLAANACGIDRVFLVTGDPPLKGEGGRPTGVFSFNSFELIDFVKTLNDEVFSMRPFSIGAALNVNAPNFEKELSRAEKKQACGAHFFLTQPVFSEEAKANLRLARERLSSELLCGIMPVAGYKNARFLQNEVPGTGVPQSLVEALEGKSADEARDVSLGEAQRTIDELYDFCDGFFLMLPLKKVDYLTHLIEYIQSKEVQ